MKKMFYHLIEHYDEKNNEYYFTLSENDVDMSEFGGFEKISKKIYDFLKQGAGANCGSIKIIDIE